MRCGSVVGGAQVLNGADRLSSERTVDVHVGDVTDADVEHAPLACNRGVTRALYTSSGDGDEWMMVGGCSRGTDATEQSEPFF